MTGEEHVLEYLPAYALDCLDEAETLQVAGHLSECAHCRAELASFQPVADSLGLAAPEAVPSPGVKEALMERVRASQAHAPARRTPWDSLRQALRGAAPLVATASLALALILFASNLLLWRQVADLRAGNSGELRFIRLEQTVSAPVATGMLVLSVDGASGTLVVDGLPALPDEQQYQLWLVEGDQRTSGGVFSVYSNGYGALWIHSPEPLNSYDSIGITVEPYGGSYSPTGDKVLGADIGG